MDMKVNIRKLLFITLWCAIGVAGMILLGAAIHHRNNKTCQGYRIDITGRVDSDSPFMNKKEIGDLLISCGAGNWQGRHILSFDLRRMETALEKNAWIRDAELFFDNNGILRVNVTEREPVARIFTVGGNTFYIDSSGVNLPVQGKLPAELPVFTGFPDAKNHWRAADSALAVQVRRLGTVIHKDPFWSAQIAQVDITPARTFEMVPMIGDHLIEFGDGNDPEQKFHRLFVFYKEVLIRTGFDKYSRIDVQYAGQVIGTRKGAPGTRTDSLQGMRNIQQLIRTAQRMEPDTVRQQNIRPLEQNTVTEQTLTGHDLIPAGGDSAARWAKKQKPNAH
jgi:cell division protein FtsQ